MTSLCCESRRMTLCFSFILYLVGFFAAFNAQESFENVIDETDLSDVSIPAVLWANKPGFLPQQNSLYIGLLKESLPQSELISIINQSHISQDFLQFQKPSRPQNDNENELPVITVAYISNSLSSSDISLFDFVAKKIKTAKGGSVVIPFLSADNANDSTNSWTEFYDTLNMNAKLKLKFDGNSLNDFLLQMRKALEQHKPLENRRIFILVEFESKTENDVLIREVDELLNEILKDDGILLSLVTGAHHVRRKLFHGTHLEYKSQPLKMTSFSAGIHRNIQANDGVNDFLDTTIVRMTPGILFGMIVGFMVGLLSLLSFYLLHDVQPPSRYIKKYPNIGKVFL